MFTESGILLLYGKLTIVYDAPLKAHLLPAIKVLPRN